jgi:hypothetical protein
MPVFVRLAIHPEFEPQNTLFEPLKYLLTKSYKSVILRFAEIESW